MLPRIHGTVELLDSELKFGKFIGQPPRQKCACCAPIAMKTYPRISVHSIRKVNLHFVPRSFKRDCQNLAT